MVETLTRATIADLVNKKIGFSFSESSELVDSLIEEIITGIDRDGNLKISSFGTFTVNEKKARMGRNPKTKEEAIISPRKVVSFYASNILNDLVND